MVRLDLGLDLGLVGMVRLNLGLDMGFVVLYLE